MWGFPGASRPFQRAPGASRVQEAPGASRACGMSAGGVEGGLKGSERPEAGCLGELVVIL